LTKGTQYKQHKRRELKILKIIRVSKLSYWWLALYKFSVFINMK